MSEHNVAPVEVVAVAIEKLEFDAHTPQETGQ